MCFVYCASASLSVARIAPSGVDPLICWELLDQAAKTAVSRNKSRLFCLCSRDRATIFVQRHPRAPWNERFADDAPLLFRTKLLKKLGHVRITKLAAAVVGTAGNEIPFGGRHAQRCQAPLVFLVQSRATVDEIFHDAAQLVRRGSMQRRVAVAAADARPGIRGVINHAANASRTDVDAQLYRELHGGENLSLVQLRHLAPATAGARHDIRGSATAGYCAE